MKGRDRIDRRRFLNVMASSYDGISEIRAWGMENGVHDAKSVCFTNAQAFGNFPGSVDIS